jgi:predicted small metal-binding protein
MQAVGVGWRLARPAERGETEMRAIDCPCGHHLEGADDEELFRKAREHIDRDHPEMERSDEDIRRRVESDAYEVTGA